MFSFQTKQFAEFLQVDQTSITGPSRQAYLNNLHPCLAKNPNLIISTLPSLDTNDFHAKVKTFKCIIRIIKKKKDFTDHELMYYAERFAGVLSINNNSRNRRALNQK